MVLGDGLQIDTEERSSVHSLHGAPSTITPMRL